MKRTSFLTLVFLVVPILMPHEAAADSRRHGRILDRNPPRLRLEAPRFVNSSEFRVHVKAEDPSGVSKVFIALDGEIVGARIDAPYFFHVTAQNLPVEVCAIADDRFGNSARDCVVVQPPGPCVLGVACEEDQFCDRAVGDCDGEGVCEPFPVGESCPAVFLPVCGCDGVTYGNSCWARMSGVSVDFRGPCDEAGR